MPILACANPNTSFRSPTCRPHRSWPAWGLGLASLCALLSGIAVQAGESPGTPAPAEKIALRVSLSGLFEELDTEEDPFRMMLGGNSSTGVRTLQLRLEEAARTPGVSSVLLSFDLPLLNWTHALMLREGIQRLKDAGKTVIAHGDLLTTEHYLLAAACSRVYLSVDGLLDLRGLSARQYYFKGTLDKLGIQAQILHLGSHKGAGEPLTQTGPSKEAAEMINWILDDRYALLCEEVGRLRGKDAGQGKTWVEGGPYTAKEALAAGLVDGLCSRLAAIEETKKSAGLPAGARLVTNFGRKKPPAIDFANPFSIFKIFSEMMKPKAPAAQQPAIGLLYAIGGISDGAGAEGLEEHGIHSLALIRHLEAARKDPNLKAVVMRIDSPGGSAIASEAIHDAVARLKAAKPVIVSAGAIAASGGYYIAAPAERIFVHPTSLVGSIGVVGGKMSLKGLYDWAGISTQVFQRGGPKVGWMDEAAGFRPEEEAWFQKMMTETYERFVEVVKAGRGARLKDFEAKIAGGKVFTGRQALENGLADELGGLSRALEYAAGRAGLKAGGYEVRVVNPPLGFSEVLLKKMGGQEDEGAEIATPGKLLGQAPGAGELRRWVAALQALQPGLEARLQRQLEFLGILARNQLLLAMPCELELRP